MQTSTVKFLTAMESVSTALKVTTSIVIKFASNLTLTVSPMIKVSMSVLIAIQAIVSLTAVAFEIQVTLSKKEAVLNG